MGVSWDYNWSSSDDGSVFSGSDIENIQNNIDTAIDLKVSVPGGSAQGDVLYYSGSSHVRLAPGTAGQMLRTAGSSANPTWSFPVSVGADLTDAATIATNAALGTHFRIELTDNRTLGEPTNPTNGQKITWEVIQDAGGTNTLAYNAVFAFGTDVPEPTLTVTGDKRDFITAVYNSTADKWYVLAVSKGY